TDQLTRPLISAWQQSLKDREADDQPNSRGQLKPATRSLYAIAARQLLTYAAGLQCLDFRLTLAIVRVKVHRGLPRPIPPDDLARIAPYLDRMCTGRTLIWLRTRALFWFLICSGARIREALQLERPTVTDMVSTDSAAAFVTR